MRKPDLRLAVWAFLVAAVACAPRVAPAPAAEPKQSLLLISLDGFRWDYISRPEASHIRALAARGVRAERMVPSVPSLTFPNHYTIVTGLYPDHHGIVSNAMLDATLGRFGIGDNPAVRDGRWWGGEPIWNTAEKQHLRAAPISWPGSEADINGMRPSWYEKFDTAIPTADRARKTLALLAFPADSAPRLITQYFPQIDHEGHYFGPVSPQVNAAIAKVDSAVGAIIDGIDRMGLRDRWNIIVLADHGMAELIGNVYLDDYVPPDSMDVIEYGATTSIYAVHGNVKYVYDRLHGANPHMTVYRKADIPARFHYGKNPRVAPIVIFAEEGWNLTARKREASFTAPLHGNHGFDNQLVSMGALFVAAGPVFKSDVVVPPFQNIHVYDLMARVLGLRPAPNDGSPDSTRAMLRNP